MTKIKIAFQGEKGAYSHIACEEVFGDVEIKNCTTFEETFKIVFDDENYIHGTTILFPNLIWKFKWTVTSCAPLKMKHIFTANTI